MGMLMHHTWLEQQKKAAKAKEKAIEPVAEETKKPSETSAVKKTATKRKAK